MKTLIFGYFDLNFGDDWLIHEFCDQYKKNDIILVVSDEKLFTPYEKHGKYKSIKSIGKLKSIISCDEIFIVGGSMFQQSKNWFPHFMKLYMFFILAKILGKNIKVCGCNLSDIKNHKFNFLMKLIFKLISNFRVRDKLSYILLNKKYNIPENKIQLLPDIADVKNIRNINNKKHACSVSIINNREINNEIYFSWLKEKIGKLYIEENVTDFTFYSYDSGKESDKLKIEQFINELDLTQYKIKIDIFNYNGDINSFIKNWSSNSFSICTRFHSYILSRNSNQIFTIFGYSSKTQEYILTHHPEDRVFLYVP